jgi:metallo-beta-lactamase family protein
MHDADQGREGQGAHSGAMRLTFLGAAETVTGSKYLLECAGKRVLVDCGLFQGYKALRLRNWAPLPVDAAGIDAVVLTHAHIDHSGWLPLLVRSGFRGPVFSSEGTLDLCRIMLPDSGWLQEEEAQYANRHKLSKHDPALPLYTREDAVRCLASFRALPTNEPREILPGIRLELARSGHMVGSTFVRVEGDGRSILFSGDIGRPDDLVLKAPEAMGGADYLVVESTYGDRDHAPAEPFRHLADAVNRTVRKGGVVVIPAFAVGRAQSLLYCLHRLKREGRIPDVPVYLNSPMAASAMGVYWKHRGDLRLDDAECDAVRNAAHVVESPGESERLNSRREPMIIVAASGMATGGRVVHHLKAFAPNARNTIVLAGYQAGGTRGASLAAGAATVRIHGQDIPVRAEVVQLDDLSAHADGTEIVQWLRGFAKAPVRTFITHGEPAAADAMRLRIERSLHWPCEVPYYLQAVDL